MEEHDSDHEAEQQVEEGGSTKRTIRRWTQEEHQKLVALVAKQQEAGQTEICWSAIARELPGRTGKQCRHRWVNSCQPFTKRGVWDLDEEHIVAQLHATHGSAWSHIASKLKGRSENSVKNHYNALYRSKYLDSKKESVLANYVKLLREGQPQCVETYEQALEITRVYREQAISRISPGGRLLSQQAVQQQPAPQMQQQQQLMQQVGDLGAGFDWQYALQDLAPDGLLAGQAATMASGDLTQLPQLQDGGSGAGWSQPSSSSISRGAAAGPSQHEAPGRTLSLLGRTAMFSQMDGLTLAPEVDLSQLLELPAMVPAAGGSTSGAPLAPAARGNTQSCPGLPTSGNSQPLGDLLAELGSMPAGGAQQQEVGRGPDAYATWISYSGTGGASPDLLQELQAMQQLPGGASGVVVTSQVPAEGVVVDSSSGLLRMQDLLARAQPAVSGGSGMVSASGHGTVTSPLLQMMQQAAASRDHASMSGKEAGMGRIGEDAALVPQEGSNAQAPGGGVPRARPSRRRSYAELYADSNNVAQMLSQLQDGSRSQPGSSLVAAYGPSSATAVAGAPSSGPISGAQLNLSRNGSTSLGTYAGNKRPSTDLGAAYGPPGFADGPRPSSGPLPGTTLADLAPDGPNGFVQASGGSGSALPGLSVAWGGARDAVFLPPGWAPTPNLNDDNEIDCNLYLAPRAPRVRRVGAAESVSGGPSPTATAAASELPLSGGNTAAVDGPTVSAARRRRHSVAYFPSAVEQPMMGLVAAEVDMTDLAAYVPGQNRRRSMSVLPSTSGTLPPPMHMGVSDAPQGRKQRFRRRSTEVYSSGGPLSAGQLLDPSLLTLLTNGSNTNTTQAPPSGTQSGSPLANTFDYFGAMQVDASTLLMHPSQTSVLDTQAPAADGHTGLTPMVSGIDIQATRAANGVLYATTSSVGEPASAMSAPATLHHLGFIYAHAGDGQADGAAVDPAYWDQLQEALGGLASHAGSNVQQRGGAQQQLASAGASTQLYISTGDVDAAALLDGLEAQAQVAREGAASTHSPAAPHLSAQPSPGQLSAQPSPAHSTGGGGYNAPAARSGQGSPAPSTTDLLGAGRVVTTQGLGAEGSAPGLAHPSSAPARPGIPLLDTNMSVSFNLGRLLSPGSELVSPHLGSLFAAGNSVDVSGGDPVLCELRSLGRDDNSFKERLNIGQQPMSSLDVLLEGSNGEAM